MIDYFVMMAVSLCMASVIEKRLRNFDSVLQGMRYDGLSKILYLIMTVWLVFFAGLRTANNDTGSYIESFIYIVQKGPINWSEISLLNYGGFDIYQQLLKTYISDNAQCLIFVSALITTVLYMHYIAKHSNFYCGAIALFFFNLYAFSMAGIKQAIAIAIAFYGIDAVNRKKYLSATLIFLIAFGFHPYVICLLSMLFLRDRVWDKKTVLLCIGSALIVANLETFFGAISSIGKSYSIDEFSNYTINPFRVVIEAVPIVISFLYRRQINATKDKMLILGTNMNIIGFFFLSLGLFVNPMYMGRIATYFTALSMISIPKMLKVAFGNKENQIFIKGYYSLMAAYFVLDLTKLGSISLAWDRFKHMPIETFFRIIFGG